MCLSMCLSVYVSVCVCVCLNVQWGIVHCFPDHIALGGTLHYILVVFHTKATV